MMFLGKMIQLFSFSMILLGALPHAFADEYRFTVSSEKWDELNHIKNCLDYNSCEFTYSALGGDAKAIRYHTFLVTSKESEVRRLMSRCSKNDFVKNLRISNDTKKETLPAIDGEVDVPSYSSLLPHIYLKKLNDAEKTSFLNEITEFLKNKKYNEAIKSVLLTYGFSTDGYTVEVDEKKERESCVTDHAKKTVKMGLDFTLHSCAFVLAIRHEVEHIHQVKKADECREEGDLHGFESHGDRERSAYLNDLYSLDSICSEAEATEMLKENALDNFNRYLREK